MSSVYEAAKERIRFIFDEFDNVFVGFSGGKDSGVLLNLCIDHARAIGRRFTVMYIDLEAMYSATTDFVRLMIEENQDVIDPHWICLPMTTTNAVSMFEPFWVFWDETKKERWVRPMPEADYVISTKNNPFKFWQDRMTFEKFVVEYGRWQAENHGKTACLLGLRTDESLNRWRSINRKDVGRYKNRKFSVDNQNGCVNFYPIFDWHVSDIWTYNAKLSKPYNRIYDKMHLAGVPVHNMRVCEPFGDEQRQGLNLYKILEPQLWPKLLDRVSGANFGNIYCRTTAIGERNVKLPVGHTWKSYCKFLLKTLPVSTRQIYTQKFIKFIRYWSRTGSPLTDDMIRDLKPFEEYVCNTGTYSKRGKGDKQVVKFKKIPDQIVHDNRTDMLSWKRMCMAIIKNDITCKSLSFSMTKQQQERRRAALEKYSNIL